MTQDAITLEVQPRDVTGKAVKQLRNDGIVPAVIHDHGKPSINVQGEYLAMYKTFKQAGRHHAVTLSAGGKKYTTIIKAVTFEPKKNMLSHIVFNAVNRNEKIETDIPLRPKYEEGNDVSPAERAGLMVLAHADTVLVDATATNLPDFIEYDAEKLTQVGDSVTVADLKAPANVTIKTEPETVIASVFEPSAVAAANDAAGGEVDESNVPADNGATLEDDAATQGDENRPGGKKAFESNEDHKNES